MKRTLFLYSVFLILTVKGYSQTDASGYIPNYDPPSPEASALGKYVDHPVSTFTGVPSINIPLFEIKCGRITLPINVSYHGSGVKVDEIASRVGIGWVLNAGGAITRTVKGLPDDAGSTTTPPLIGDWASNGNGYFNRDASNMSLEYVENDPSSPLTNDLEPDVYFYNFGNKSGKIFFETRTLAYALNKDPIRISGPFNGTNRFVITAEDGLIYTFEAAEGTSSGTIGFSTSYTSTWYITRIDDPVTGKNIQFSYRTDMPTQLGYTAIPFEGQGVTCSSSGGGSPTNIGVFYPKVLQKITYDEGYIEFKADYNRSDLTGDKAYTEINQYIYADNTQSLKKGFNLSYYTSSNGSAQENRRLYLETIKEKGADGSFLPPYQFFYNNRDLLPERQSPQQDIWGYYNANGSTARGAYKIYQHNYGDGSGRDYLPFDNPADPSTNVTPGVDRSSNGTVAGYGMLSKIIYPTKGYTLYNFELNTFDLYTGGGIRIKAIADYSADDQLLLLKNYAYSGGFLGGPYPQIAFPNSSGALVFFWTNRTVLGSNEGNYVGYATVSVTQSATHPPIGGTYTNGTAYFNYTTDKDVPGTFSVISNSCSDLSNLTTIRTKSLFPFFEWESREDRRGLLASETDLDNQGNFVKGITYNYTLSPGLATVINMSYPLYNPDGHRANLLTDLRGTRNLNNEKMLLTAKVETLYKGNPDDRSVQAIINNTTDYTYTQGNYDGAFIRSETTYASNATSDPLGDFSMTEYTYPFDYSTTASGGIMNTMVTMNYINPAISKTGSRWASPNDVYCTGAQINNYKHNPFYSTTTNSTSIVPAQVFILNTLVPVEMPVTVSDPSNPGTIYEKRADYINYDSNANPTLVANDNKYQILNWSLRGDHLLSKIQVSDPSAQSFFLPPQSWSEVTDANAKTGMTDYIWTGYDTPFPITLNGGSNTLVSFWARGGNFTIEATGGDPHIYNNITQTAPATWKFYSFVLPTTGQAWANGNVSIIGDATLGSATLDNVYIVTAGSALSTNYSYDNLLRLQSVLDGTGKLRSFDYDTYNRLINTRDQDNNILKHVEYHFKGQ
jgi:YD repeat-containing protein